MTLRETNIARKQKSKGMYNLKGPLLTVSNYQKNVHMCVFHSANVAHAKSTYKRTFLYLYHNCF